MAREIAVIGPDLFTLGFKLVGVRKTTEAEDPEALTSAVRKAMADREVGILVMQTEDVQRIDPALRRQVEDSIQPTLVSIGVGEDATLREKLKQAIGVDVWK